MSCVVGGRLDLDPALLRLWCRRAAAALIDPLAWEVPYVASTVLKIKRNTANYKQHVLQHA